MTTNQIAYQSLVETRRHNQVEEKLTSQRDVANRVLGGVNAASNLISGGSKIAKAVSGFLR